MRIVRTEVEVLLDLLSAMAEVHECSLIGEAYAQLYQALGAFLLGPETPEDAIREVEAFRRGGGAPRADRALEALRALEEMSPADARILRAALERALTVVDYCSHSAYVESLREQ